MSHFLFGTAGTEEDIPLSSYQSLDLCLGTWPCQLENFSSPRPPPIAVVQLPGRVLLFVTPWTGAHRLLCEWSHALLQGILPTQRLNPGLSHRRQIRNRLSHPGSPVSPYRLLMQTLRGPHEAPPLCNTLPFETGDLLLTNRKHKCDRECVTCIQPGDSLSCWMCWGIHRART